MPFSEQSVELVSVFKKASRNFTVYFFYLTRQPKYFKSLCACKDSTFYRFGGDIPLFLHFTLQNMVGSNRKICYEAWPG